MIGDEEERGCRLSRPALRDGQPVGKKALIQETAAVAWQFTQAMLASVVPASNHRGLVNLSERLEQTSEFLKYPPVGPGVEAANPLFQRTAFGSR